MCFPGFARQGVATICAMHWKNWPVARGAAALTVEASDTAGTFFLKRGYMGQQRNTISIGEEWLASHHNEEITGRRCAARRDAGKTIMSRERLYLFDTTLRDGAQTNGVDFTLHDKQRRSRTCSTISASTMSRAAIPAPIPTGYRVLRDRSRSSTREVHRLRHDKAAGPLGLERSGSRRACWRPRPTRSASWPRSSDYQVRVALETTQGGKSRLDPRQRDGARRPPAARCMLDCEHFFDGYKANPRLSRWPAPKRPMTPGALGRAVRHQRRHAAARNREDRRARSRKHHSRRSSRHPCP